MANPSQLSTLISYGSSLTIAETAPAGAGYRPRTLILVASALPFQGAEWGFENQVVTTWYSGNPVEATQQNLGPRELPSAWEGEWKRTLLGRNPAKYFDEQGNLNSLVSPHVIRDVFEQIARAGVRLRVTWAVRGNAQVGGGFGAQLSDVNVSIVREGLVKSFKTPIVRHTDIRWNVEFHWASRGGTQDRVASVRQDSDLANASDQVEQAVNATLFFSNAKIRSINANIRKSSVHLTLGQLEALANTPKLLVTAFTRKLQQNVSQFKRAGQIVRNVRSQFGIGPGQTSSLAQSVRDFAQNTTAVANQFQDDVGRRPPELLSNKARPAAVFRATTYFYALARASALCAQRGQELADRVRKTTVAGGNRGEISVRNSSTTRAGDVVAVHVVKTGDTPQTISRRYYGNSEHGADILRANRLPLYTPSFVPGTALVIPSLAIPAKV